MLAHTIPSLQFSVAPMLLDPLDPKEEEDEEEEEDDSREYSHLHSFDLRTEFTELFIDHLVPSIDVIYTIDLCLSIGHQAG